MMFLVVALFSFIAIAVAIPSPQGHVSRRAPDMPSADNLTSIPGQDCKVSFKGKFAMVVASPESVNVARTKLGCRGGGSLENGVFTEADGRKLYVSSEGEFKFDRNPPAGSSYDRFRICDGGLLSVGAETVSYVCPPEHLTGDEKADRERMRHLTKPKGDGCMLVHRVAIPCGPLDEEDKKPKIDGVVPI